jgi:hypothetical protein
MCAQTVVTQLLVKRHTRHYYNNSENPGILQICDETMNSNSPVLMCPRDEQMDG